MGVEVVIGCRRQATGCSFAYELSEVLCEAARLQPVPYHGGLFIGRDCHAIGDHSDALYTALETKMCGLNGESAERAQTYLTGYKAA